MTLMEGMCREMQWAILTCKVQVAHDSAAFSVRCKSLSRGAEKCPRHQLPQNIFFAVWRHFLVNGPFFNLPLMDLSCHRWNSLLNKTRILLSLDHLCDHNLGTFKETAPSSMPHINAKSIPS
ncbi:hypothetical protein XELAEV_18017007mg [Xenopus laevis]|uniref:Uncharacterized protein n=1 Tax=Xenopus laevis TaxID=8355 RepID=A0A974DCB3_XENLA|nr:hypothetical protein XELAEV_18017007mg [Xenopus laevis]